MAATTQQTTQSTTITISQSTTQSNEPQRPTDLQTAFMLIAQLQETIQSLTSEVSSLKWKLSHGETQLDLLKAENKFLQDSVSDLRIQQKEMFKMQDMHRNRIHRMSMLR